MQIYLTRTDCKLVTNHLHAMDDVDLQLQSIVHSFVLVQLTV